MPTVQAYGPQKVDTTPLPGARKTGPAGVADTAASLGGGIGDALANLGETGARVADQAMSVVDKVRADEQNQADQVALLSASRQKAEAEHQALFGTDGTDGALGVRGHDTLGLRDVVKGKLLDRFAAIDASTLTNDKQRIRAQADSDQRWESIGHTLDAHTLEQMGQWDASETKAAVDTSVQAAVAHSTDPVGAMERVGLELGRGVSAITDFAARHGIGDETRDAQVAAFRSSVHVGVVKQLLAKDQAGKAAIYFEHAREFIAGEDQPALVAALDVGTTRTEAQQQADAIVAAGGTLTEQRAKAKAITDAAPDDPHAAKVRDAVTGLIEHEYAVKQAADRDHEEQAALDGAHIVDTLGSTKFIPPATWAGYSLATMASLKSYEKSLTEKGHVETDWNTFYPLFTMGTNEATRDKFAQVNLLDYRGSLADGEFKQLTELQAAVRKGDMSAADRVAAADRQQAQIVNEGLASAGLDPTPAAPGAPGYNKDMADRVVQFRRAVREASARQAHLNGDKPATDAQVQSIVDAFLTPVTPETFHLFGANDPRRLAFETAQAQATAAADVPAGERRRIEAALRRNGRPVTDAEVLRLFNLNLRTLRGDR